MKECSSVAYDDRETIEKPWFAATSRIGIIIKLPIICAVPTGNLRDDDYTRRHGSCVRGPDRSYFQIVRKPKAIETDIKVRRQ